MARGRGGWGGRALAIGAASVWGCFGGGGGWSDEGTYGPVEDPDGEGDGDDDTTPATEDELEPEEQEEPEDPGVCSGAPQDATEFTMSADDSNSQAALPFVREAILAGWSDQITGWSFPVYEFWNYQDFAYPASEDGTLRITAEMRPVEGDPGAYEMLIGVSSPPVTAAERKPMNLAFSIDASGSMQGAALDRAKAVMRAVASSLREGDIVSLVTWDTTTNVVLGKHTVAGPDDPSLLQAVAGLQANGGTDLYSGLQAAYTLAQENHSPARISRVMLISDGGANVGVTEAELIGDMARDVDGEGIYTLGVGVASFPGAFNGQLMNTVTDLGKGAFVYVDSDAEAERWFTGDRLVNLVSVAGRDVGLNFRLPAHWLLEEATGKVAGGPGMVYSQHLAPNDAMVYHHVVRDCVLDEADGTEPFGVAVHWVDPLDGVLRSAEIETTAAEMLLNDGWRLDKAQASISFVRGMGVPRLQLGRWTTARVIQSDAEIADIAARWPEDAEIAELHSLFRTYRTAVAGWRGTGGGAD
ncbi:VWA domain-containing protein [Myxococcota bacterium]|nr:VWA domain-containing protein [Myxococcota bacterium]